MNTDHPALRFAIAVAITYPVAYAALRLYIFAVLLLGGLLGNC